MFEQFDRVVRCNQGHLFQTIWIPLVSFKALRLGWRRYQFCPVGRHWTFVKRVDEGVVSAEMLGRLAHDVRIP